MVVGFEKSQGPVARLDCGYGQTKSDSPTEIFCQWRASLLQTIQSAGFGTYQASVAAGMV